MTSQQDNNLKPMPEQIFYANLLFIGAWTGIALMIITYFLYVAGIISPHVDITVITQNWNKGVDEYLSISHSPHGWGWIKLLNKGDFLNYLGLVFIAVLTIICYIFLIIGYRKRKDWAYFAISLIEVLVLVLAASGILGVGGH
ncbi:DUF1634 domain-containing protein [Thermodesulfobacteriota bacterium]